jgi:hypothetical protein
MTDQPNAPAPAPQPDSPPPAQPPAPPPPVAPASAAPAAPVAPAKPSAMSNLLAGVSQGEMLMLGGALLYLIGDLVFGLTTGYYVYSSAGWLVVAIMILVHARPMGGLSVPAGGYRFGLIVLGLVALVAGIRYLISDLIYIPGRNLNVMYFLGALVFYVAVLLMAAGAWQIWRRQPQ